jgi:GNAT superfamily N-acetyltransferase
MSSEEMQENPSHFARILYLSDGEKFTFRLLLPSDSESFGNFLEGLTPEIRKRFAPHPLTPDEAKKICQTLKYSEILRFITVNIKREIVGYFILSFPFREEEISRYENYGLTIIDGKDVRIAPVIADAYQNKGLGSLMMKETIDVARHLELRYLVLWGGTQATNDRAIHFYNKFGFKKVGEFKKNDMNNFDMYMEL